MNLSRLNISGGLHNDTGTLEKFSRDMSAYRILPALVVEPKNEQDVLKTLKFTKNEGLRSLPPGTGYDAKPLIPGKLNSVENIFLVLRFHHQCRQNSVGTHIAAEFFQSTGVVMPVSGDVESG